MSYTRKKVGKTFHYFDGDKEITDPKTLDRIRSLVIPPAWKDVTIASSPTAKVQATGIDKAGRTQALYHPDFRAQQEKAKFERILSFAEHLPAMRRQVEKDLARRSLSKEKVLACIVKLMDEEYFRVGNDIYAKSHQTYGITTLRSKHTTISHSSVTFDFTGKSGQKHHKVIKDKQIARIIRQLDELPGYEIFEYLDEQGTVHKIHSADVNAYIKHYMGEEFTAKDFRTWGGTLLATAALASAKRAKTERERKRTVTACVKKVARKLGNTPAVARSSYIDARILDAYMQSDELTEMAQAIAAIKPKKYLKAEEIFTLRVLQKSALSSVSKAR